MYQSMPASSNAIKLSGRICYRSIETSTSSCTLLDAGSHLAFLSSPCVGRYQCLIKTDLSRDVSVDRMFKGLPSPHLVPQVV